MKQIKAVVIGYGDRGSIYSSYSLIEPTLFKIVGVVDKNPYRLEMAKKNLSLNDNELFTDLDDFLATHIDVDLYINATMDEIHYEILKKIITTGKSILTEKPIVNNKVQLLELEQLANRYHTQVFVGHVLRYTAFYKRIKKLILAGEIGEIRSIEMAEHVGSAHFAGSYIRGRWKSEKECGSTTLLAKSCHDIDIMCWLNNNTEPEEVSSFGGRFYFLEENAPKGATEFCYNCPHEKNCYYSAIKMYVDADFSCEQTFLVKDREKLTREERIEFLKHDNFGRCVYKMPGADMVDRQAVIIKFKNNSIGSFTLVGAAPEAGRTISIVGTNGEIKGIAEQGIIHLKKDVFSSTIPHDEVIDINNELFSGQYLSGHNGGDYAIMKSVIEFLNGKKDMVTITKLSDSINGHLCVYAADESRISNKIITIKR